MISRFLGTLTVLAIGVIAAWFATACGSVGNRAETEAIEEGLAIPPDLPARCLRHGDGRFPRSCTLQAVEFQGHTCVYAAFDGGVSCFPRTE